MSPADEAVLDLIALIDAAQLEWAEGVTAVSRHADHTAVMCAAIKVLSEVRAGLDHACDACWRSWIASLAGRP